MVVLERRHEAENETAIEPENETAHEVENEHPHEVDSENALPPSIRTALGLSPIMWCSWGPNPCWGHDSATPKPTGFGPRPRPMSFDIESTPARHPGPPHEPNGHDT